MTKISLLLLSLASVFPWHKSNEIHPFIRNFNEQDDFKECKSAKPPGSECAPLLLMRWLNWKPFISRKNDSFEGLFPDFFRTLKKSCKDGCREEKVILGHGKLVTSTNKTYPRTNVTINYEKEIKSHEEMMKDIQKEAESVLTSVNHTTLYLPVPVTESYQRTVYGFPFIFSFGFNELLYLERKVKGDRMSLIFQGVRNSWQFVSVVVFLAGLFGILIWIVVCNIPT